MLAILVIVGISSCSNLTNSDSTETEAVDVPVKNAVTIKTNEEKNGGDIKIYLPKGVQSLNPFRNSSVAMEDIYSLIYEKVIYIDGNNKPQGMLAESWEIGEDSKTFTITLRDNVYFSNGTKFTSKDVVYTYNLIKSTAAQGVSKYTDIIQAIASIDEIDDRHIKVTGVKTGLNTLYALNFPVLCKAASASTTPIGTGPFKLSSYVKDSKLVLVPNEKWWKPQPYLNSITAICYSSEKDALEAFAKGEIDIIDTESVSSDIYRKSASANRYKLPTSELNYLLINTTKANLKNKGFRQALNYAIDKKKIINNVYISHADPVDAPLLPTDWRYSTAYTQYNYDYDKALTLFNSLGMSQKETVEASSGLKTYKLMQGSSQVSLKILVIDDTSRTLNIETANNIKNDLNKIGISVEIVKKIYTDYLKALSNGDFDIAVCNVVLKNDMDVSNMLTSDTGAAYYLNYGKYSNSTLSSYINAYANSKDESTILSNTASFQKLFTEELPFICLNFKSRSLLINDNIGGVTETLTDNVFNGINAWYIK